MDRFILIATGQSSKRHPQTPADAAQWVEVYFPRVEFLLQRLARYEYAKRRRSRLLSFWATVAVVAILICVPGYPTAATLLMTARNFDMRPVSAKQQARFVSTADSVPVESAALTGYPGEETPGPVGAIHEVVLLDDFALRGSVESALFTISTSVPSRAVPQRSRRHASRVAPVKLPAERPDTAPRSLSLLEKMFSVIVSGTQLSQRPETGQT